MDKIVCNKNFFDKYDHETLFIAGEEYFFIKDETFWSIFNTVYVYHNKIGHKSPHSGYRFHTNKNETHEVLEYFYDYFENPRLSKLKKIKLIYG